MANSQASLLDLTVEVGIPGDVMRALIGGKHIVYIPFHDRLLEDMVNENIEEDTNATCDEDANKHVTKMRIQHMTRI